MIERARCDALKLAVIGDPVAHSASPGLHRRFLAAAAIAGTYEAIRVAAGRGACEIDALRAAGYTGLNVTTPLKEEAFARADERDSAALAAGAVNTLVFVGTRVSGHNTDGIGAIGALREAVRGDDLRGARVLVLGAGPTARAVIPALVAERCVVTVWNRTCAKAEAIARAFGIRSWEPRDVADAIFYALPPQAVPTDRALVATLRETPLVIDANYGCRSTLGAVLGREVIDGASMLAAGARASFALFRTVLAER